MSARCRGRGAPLSVIQAVVPHRKSYGNDLEDDVTSPKLVNPDMLNTFGDAVFQPAFQVARDIFEQQPTQTLSIDIDARDPFVFVTEVIFAAAEIAPVSLPARLPLVLGPLGVLGWLSRRRLVVAGLERAARPMATP